MKIRSLSLLAIVMVLSVGLLSGCFVEREGPPRGPSTVIDEDYTDPNEETPEDDVDQEEDDPTETDSEEDENTDEDQAEDQPAVIIHSPQPNESISAPLTIRGEAKGGWFFEANIPIRLVDDQGNELAVVGAQAQENWMQEGYVSFEGTMESFDPGSASSGKLIIEKSNPSGLPEYADQIEIPVRFSSDEVSTVEIYFPNTIKDPEMLDCGNVYKVQRTFPKTPGVARAALEELLKGPTADEKQAGYITSINQGVEIQSLVVEDGVAKVDFNKQLEYQVGGSCRIHSIYSQIQNTLMQFPTVTEVEISIDGRTEDILQP